MCSDYDPSDATTPDNTGDPNTTARPLHITPD